MKVWLVICETSSDYSEWVESVWDTDAAAKRHVETEMSRDARVVCAEVRTELEHLRKDINRKRAQEITPCLCGKTESRAVWTHCKRCNRQVCENCSTREPWLTGKKGRLCSNCIGKEKTS